MSSEIDLASPSTAAFEYTVRIQLWLPQPHAQMLRETALHHYDAAVRESAECGPINGLLNVALWTGEWVAGSWGEDRRPTWSALNFRDLDTALKAMETAQPKTGQQARIATEIRRVLRDAMRRVAARSNEINNPT